jgi:hypothetical protein
MRLLLYSVLSILCLQASATAADIFPVPKSPNQLMANFVRAINEQNIEEYERILHPEFIFAFAPDHRSLAPPDGTWDREREIRSMSRLLSGQEGMTPYGEAAPAVRTIRLTLDPIECWAHVQSDLETWTRTYDSVLLVIYDDGRRESVLRRQVFTLTSRRSEHDLQTGTFEMYEWQELENTGSRPRPHGLVRGRF